MKFYQKTLCLLICLSMLAVTCFAGGNELATLAADVDYTIDNPYADVNWETVDQYKTALHTHTSASDGHDTLKESVEKHYLTGFDLVATTDHGTSNKSWINTNYSKFIYTILNLGGGGEKLDYLGTEGTFAGGMDYTMRVDEKTGDEYLVTADGREILRIPYGIENNAVSVNAHVNSWFVEYQDNTINDYETTIKAIDKLGGISVINHPGEYTKAKEELTSEEAYNLNNWSYRYYINKFSGLLEKYPSCIGIDINSKGDSRTRYERELWDILLSRSAPKGRNVFAIASSDAHNLHIINSGYSLLLMEDKTSAAARHSLESGEFFAASHCLGNYQELVDIAAAVKEFYGETDVYNEITKVTALMEQRVADVESGAADADESLGYTYSLLDDNGYSVADADPSITGIAVDNTADSITVSTQDALIVRWISNGKLIETSNAANGRATLDLDDYSQDIGNYVRVEVFGEGGIVYSQAFLLDYEGAPEADSYIYFNIPVFDFLFANFKNWGDILGRMIKNLF